MLRLFPDEQFESQNLTLAKVFHSMSNLAWNDGGVRRPGESKGTFRVGDARMSDIARLMELLQVRARLCLRLDSEECF